MSLISIPTQKSYISNKIKLKFSNNFNLKNDIEKCISKDITKQLTEALNDIRGDTDDQKGRSFSDITLLALAYFYTEIFPHKRKNSYYTINAVKGFLDSNNLTLYTATYRLDEEYYELLNAPLFDACWLIIQSAWFFNSKHFGKHQHIDYMSHYASTGKMLPIENYIGDADYLVKKYKEFDKQKRKVNGYSYSNAWYYSILFLVCNELRLPINNFKVSIKYDRESNPLTKVRKVLRPLAPFLIAESDITSAFATFIDNIVGSNLKDCVYTNLMSLRGIPRSEAKMLFNKICNSGKFKTKNDTRCFFADLGYTYEQANDLIKLTHNEEKGFYHFMTPYEKNAVETFKTVNNLIGCVRLHDSVLFIYKGKKPQILVVNGNCEFGFKLLNSPVYNSTLVLPETSLNDEITTSFVEPVDDNLSIIINEINKYKRIEGEVLNGYLGDIVDQLIKSWSVSHINILNSPPSSGKTSMVLQLIKEGKRILLLVPTKAIIKNKKLNGVAQIFGDIDIKKYLNTTDSLICTFDKGSQLEVDDLLKFDYVIIDESHLLFTEDYRMNALVLLLKKIELYMQNMRKNLIPLNSTKIILMSGTPTGEEFFFEPDEKGEQITHKKVFINNKERNAILVGCVDEDSCYTSFINKIIELINNGHRVFIPTDRGEKWINAVVGVVNGFIGRDIKFEIYSNNQKDSQANIDINANSIISDDNELLFSTSLGNAGIDINNTDKRTTMVIYTDNNNPIIGQKAIQYANRFRNENVQIIVFFILPKEIKFINQEFSFGYVEDPNEILCINNDISTQLYTNEGIVNMLDDFTVDKVKVKWKALQQKLEEHFSNIISIGGYFKTMGYDVTTSKGDKTDHNIIQSRKKINLILKQLEYDSKLKALAFILTNIDDLTESLSKYTRTKGEYSLIKETLILTLENEQIFNIVRLLIRKFTQITGRFNDVALIEKFMLNWKMNFKDIEHRLKFMEFVHNDCVDDLDNTMVKEVDQLVNLNKGVGSISKQRYNDILNILAPKYINKAFNELEQNKKNKLVENLKSKLNICYIIKIGKVVEFKQRFTEVWKNETICWFKDFNAELYTEAPVNERILRNRIGDAKGLAVGKAIGKAYEHISIDLIDNINRIVDADGYITAKNIIEITGLSSNSLGGFVKAKLQNLKSSVKMIKGARETRYN